MNSLLSTALLATLGQAAATTDVPIGIVIWWVGGVIVVVGTVATVFNKFYTIRRTLEDKQEKTACSACRKEVDNSVTDLKTEIQKLYTLIHASFSDFRQEMQRELHLRATMNDLLTSQQDIRSAESKIQQQEKAVAVVESQMTTLLNAVARLEKKIDALANTRHPTLPPPQE